VNYTSAKFPGKIKHKFLLILFLLSKNLIEVCEFAPRPLVKLTITFVRLLPKLCIICQIIRHLQIKYKAVHRWGKIQHDTTVNETQIITDHLP
jgi:hypothetical protein